MISLDWHQPYTVQSLHSCYISLCRMWAARHAGRAVPFATCHFPLHLALGTSNLALMDLTKHYLFASDFDQTLSFHDSGRVLAELLGVSNFDQKVAGLAQTNLVQQGGELAYLIRHDPEFRSVRSEHLWEAGRRVRLRTHIPHLVDFLAKGIDGFKFSFYVISAAPREVILSALEGIVPADHIVGTELAYEPNTGEVRSIARVPAGY